MRETWLYFSNKNSRAADLIGSKRKPKSKRKTSIQMRKKTKSKKSTIMMMAKNKRKIDL